MAQPGIARRAPKKQIHKAVSKKRKFVKDGVFYAELNDFLANELSEQGYAGCEVRVTPQRTEIIIRATNTSDVIGDNGRRIRELTALIQKRFKFPRNGLICFAERVRNKGFSALTQAQAVKYRLLTGLTVRRAAYSCLKYIMDNSERKVGALGCEIIVSGKLRGQRAKGMKFRDGFMIHAGDAANYYIDEAVKHVHLPQGVIGIKVKIMKPYDAAGRDGVNFELPDKVEVREPKSEIETPSTGMGGTNVPDHMRGIQRPQNPQGGQGGGPGPSGGGGGPEGPSGGTGMPPRQPPQPPQGGQGGNNVNEQVSRPPMPSGGGGGFGDVNDQSGFGGGNVQDTQDQSGMVGQSGADMGGAPQYGVNDQSGTGAPQGYGQQPVQGQFEQQFDQYGGQSGQGGQQYGQQQQFDQYGQGVGQAQYGQQQQSSYGTGGQQFNNQSSGYYDQNRQQQGNYQNY